jgi:hypothetical protein
MDGYTHIHCWACPVQLQSVVVNGIPHRKDILKAPGNEISPPSLLWGVRIKRGRRRRACMLIANSTPWVDKQFVNIHLDGQTEAYLLSFYRRSC